MNLETITVVLPYVKNYKSLELLNSLEQGDGFHMVGLWKHVNSL